MGGKSEIAIDLGPHKAEMAGLLFGRLDQIAEDMLAAYRVEIGPYAGLDDPAVLEEIKNTSRLNVAVLLRSIVEERPLSPDEISALQELGRRRSEQGFPHHAMLRAYQVGTRVVWNHLLRELPGMNLDPTTLSSLVAAISASILNLTAQVSGAVSQAYLEAEREAGSLEEGARRDVVDDLLSGEIESSEELRLRAAEVGFTLGARHIAAVVGPVKGTGSVASLAAAIRSALDTGSRRPIVAPREGMVAAVVAAESWPDRASFILALRDAIGTAAIAGIGREESGVPGIHASYRQARHAMDVLRACRGLPGVLTYEEALPFAMLRRDQPLSLDVFRASIEPLMNHPELLKTLDAYLECGGNLAETAKRLHVHRHTMYGRVQRIEELTGRSLDDRDDLLLFELGLRAARLLPADVTGRIDTVATPRVADRDSASVGTGDSAP